MLLRLFDAAILAAQPGDSLRHALPVPPRGRSVIVGAGKAAASMAAIIDRYWPVSLEGIVVTRYGHGVPAGRIHVIEAGHPNPDAESQRAAAHILSVASELASEDLLLCLISGGASALMALPARGLTLADKQAVTQALLRSGAAIAEINCVRKHLSAIKGGRLAAAAYPAAVVTLAISDVPGDDPTIIGSGPTVADPTTCADALAVLDRYRIDVPSTVRRHLTCAAAESPKPGDPRLAAARYDIVIRPRDALAAAARLAEAAGYRTLCLGEAIEGEARDVARAHAGIAREIRMRGQPLAPPCVLLSGGETTVTVRGKGRGGRNGEFLLALAVALDGLPGVYALAGDSDGVDGVEDNAGALIRPDTLARAARLGLDARARLADNDSYGFFAALGDLIVTGPTRTNVNDIRVILIDP